MSKGSTIVPVRIPSDLLRQVEETYLGRNLFAPKNPWTLSDFVRVALKEKIAKMQRSRKKRRKTCRNALNVAAKWSEELPTDPGLSSTNAPDAAPS